MAEPRVRFRRHPVPSPWEHRITGRFGDRYTVGGRSYLHRGVDYGVPVGTPVLVPAPGRVVPHVNDGSFGISVCLRHDDGWFTLYAHLSQAAVRIGQEVEVGQVLGRSGNTGLSTGPHLHWQLCSTASFPTDISYSRDPLRYIIEGEDDMDEATVRRIIDQRLSEVAQQAGLGTPDLARGIGAIWARLQAVARILDKHTPPPGL